MRPPNRAVSGWFPGLARNRESPVSWELTCLAGGEAGARGGGQCQEGDRGQTGDASRRDLCCGVKRIGEMFVCLFKKNRVRRRSQRE